MGLLTPRGYAKHKVKNAVYPSYPGLITYGTSIGGVPISYVSAGTALKNVNVFSVLNRIASDVASAHFKTENTAALQRLENPSRIVSRFSFWQGVLIGLCLSGNAYIPLQTGSLEHVPPSDVQINYLPGNTGIEYTVIENNDRPEMKLSQDKMLHFRLMPDPHYRYLIGRSPLESLQTSLTIDQKTTDSNLSALANQINSGGMLKIKNYLDDAPEDLENARSAFEKSNGGKNSGRLMVLPDFLDYEPFEIKTDVFKALNENASYSADRIATAFGVPSDMLGGGASTESQHSNSDQIKALYLANLNTYVNPIVDELKDKLNAPDLKLDVKSMLDVDDSILVSQVQSLSQYGSINQLQADFILRKQGYLPANAPKGGDIDGQDSSQGDNNQ